MDGGLDTDSEVDFRRVLKSIDENLVSRDVEGLKFLCRDIIPASHQEKIRRGLDLLVELESRGRISFSDTEFLAELLLRIGRLDLVRKLGYDSKLLKSTIQNRGSRLKPFRVLLQEWIDQLTTTEISNIKFLATSYVTRNHLEKVKTAQDLFLLLENQEVINEGNMDVLLDIADSLERKDLREKVLKYAGQPSNRTYRLASSQQAAAIPTMVGEINKKIFPDIPRRPQQLFNNAYSHIQEENIPINTSEATEQRHQGDGSIRNLDKLTITRTREALESMEEDIMPCYKMDARPRGICLIVNNQEFYKIQNDPESRKMPDREGTNVDCDNLEYIFTKLLFRVVILTNQTDTELVRQLVHFSQLDHRPYDCFVCCVLTHGTVGKLYGVNGRLVDLKDITNPFKAISCPKLKGKPKLFFIQACQGKAKQRGVDIQEDSPDLEADAPGDPAVLPPETLPNEADFLMGYATLPGFVSYRSKTQGSWYITTLVRILDQYGHKYDLLSLMIKVNEEVSKATALMNDEFYKQSPAPIPTLRKKIYFT